MSDCQSSSPLSSGAEKWRRSLLDFLDKRPRSVASREQLSPLQQQQRRVTGGILIQFTDLLQSDAIDEYPQLQSNPLHQRLFVCITDEAGLHAARDVLDTDTDQLQCILNQEMRAFLEAPHTLDDGEFKHHYECWSVWHQNLSEKWDMPPQDGDLDLWVHEEGFALHDGVGRGAQHLWSWDGQELSLVEELLTSWSS